MEEADGSSASFKAFKICCDLFVGSDKSVSLIWAFLLKRRYKLSCPVMSRILLVLKVSPCPENACDSCGFAEFVGAIVNLLNARQALCRPEALGYVAVLHLGYGQKSPITGRDVRCGAYRDYLSPLPT